MKLLIVTQVVDKNHPILGFFHRWIEEFAKHCNEVHVICLQEGVHTLPKNVTVYSLGKDKGKGRLTYIFNFYKYIWKLRKQYDHVFVHMNQIYVILGGLFWRLQKKKIGLWYMHGSTPISLTIAEKITNFIFTGSPESFRIPSKKVIVTGHGIDTDRFAPQENTQKTIDLITVGRIAKSKNLTALIDVLAKVRTTHDVSLTIVGQPLSHEDKIYEKAIQDRAQQKGVTDAVHFIGAVPNESLPAILNQSKIFVHAAINGSLDKAILEAIACRVIVISMAPGSKSLPLGNMSVANSAIMAKRISFLLQKKIDQEECYATVYNKHGLNHLIIKILNYYE